MIKLTLKDAALIYRAIGMVEGIAASMGNAQASTLIDAIEIIESTLKGV